MRKLLICASAVWIVACSKTDIKQSLVPSQKVAAMKVIATPMVGDPDKKWAEISCRIGNTLGVACNVIGNTCKKHDCDTGSIEIAKHLTEPEIQAMALSFAKRQVQKGYIDPTSVGQTVDIITAAIRNENQRFVQ